MFFENLEGFSKSKSFTGFIPAGSLTWTLVDRRFLPPHAGPDRQVVSIYSSITQKAECQVRCWGGLCGVFVGVF